MPIPVFETYIPSHGLRMGVSWSHTQSHPPTLSATLNGPETEAHLQPPPLPWCHTGVTGTASRTHLPKEDKSWGQAV